jgi:transcriptional regulator with XRE-family HTH domain
VNPLQELIRRRMAERDWSFADVARRGALPRSTVHHLARNERPARPPHPQTLTRLAQGLELPAAQVRAAAARAAGYEAAEYEVATAYEPTNYGTAAFAPGGAGPAGSPASAAYAPGVTGIAGSADAAGTARGAGYDADEIEVRGLVAALSRLSREDRRRVAVLVRSLLEGRGPAAGRSPARRA